MHQRTKPLLAVAIAAAIAAAWGSPLPAMAQAEASAEAQAAIRLDPNWAPPRTPWGHPDLQGIWTTDDMRGVPQQRPEEFGTRPYLTDDEFAERAARREGARDSQDRAASGTFRNEEGTRTFGYTSLVVDPPDGRIPAVVETARERRSSPGSFGLGPFNTMADFSLC